MTSNSKAVQSIIQDFQSPEPEMVLKAIKTNRKEGNQDSFKALLSLLKDTDEPLVEASIIEFLYDLKDEESVPVLIEAIQDDEFAFYHNFLFGRICNRCN
jgi:HEAT repeat protein